MAVEEFGATDGAAAAAAGVDGEEPTVPEGDYEQVGPGEEPAAVAPDEEGAPELEGTTTPAPDAAKTDAAAAGDVTPE